MELGNIIQGMERDCAKERKKLEDELFTHKCMYSLSYEEFCWALTTNANNILLKRGFMHHFEIDASNQVKWKMEKETNDHWESITVERDNVIPLTIYNTKQLILPATGGSGFGLVTMGGIALMAQAILMGTYFTLQCRKGDDKLRKKR